MNQRIANPDCRDGKHAVCDGHGWDIDADTAVRCPCTCHRCPACGNDHNNCRTAWDEPSWGDRIRQRIGLDLLDYEEEP